MSIKITVYDECQAAELRADWEDLDLCYHGLGVHGARDFRSFLYHLWTQVDKRLILYFQTKGDLTVAQRLKELAELGEKFHSLPEDELTKAEKKYLELVPTLKAHFSPA